MADADIKTSDIDNELLKFQAAADEGYKIATQKYEDIALSLLKAENQIKKAKEESIKPASLQIIALLERQDEEIKNIRESIAEIRKNLDALRETQKNFSIVVFGRKMAGKSTLMEILTHGDGNSIGKSLLIGGVMMIYAKLKIFVRITGKILKLPMYPA